jgi:uncharacterized OB-fold protein
MVGPESLGPWVNRDDPRISPEMLAFWEGLTDHQCLLTRCRMCGSWYFPYTLCSRHSRIMDFSDMEWAPASGKGQVFTFVIVDKVVDDDYQAEVPYCLAMILLDEGPLMAGRVFAEFVEDVHIGMPVVIDYIDASNGRTLPIWVAAARRES